MKRADVNVNQELLGVLNLQQTSVEQWRPRVAKGGSSPTKSLPRFNRSNRTRLAAGRNQVHNESHNIVHQTNICNIHRAICPNIP